MSDDKRNLETIPKGSLGLIPLASCKELGEKVDHYLVKWREKRQHEHKDTIASRVIRAIPISWMSVYRVSVPVKQNV